VVALYGTLYEQYIKIYIIQTERGEKPAQLSRPFYAAWVYGLFMVVTATEFKTNIGKYLSIVNEEDVFVTKNGKNVAVLVSPKGKPKSLTDSLYGIIEGADVTLEKIREERMTKHLESNH
jgi:prevent-host-death family protein